MSWNWCHLSGEHEFWAKFGSRAKIDRGGSWSPPPSKLALEPNSVKKSIPIHLTLFQNFSSRTPQKISKNWKSTEKLLKKVEIFKICNFWAISTCNTSRKGIFHIEFNFKQKKYDLFYKNVKKSKEFNFFKFFSNISYFFCLKLNSMWKMRFFEALHVEIAQKLQIFKISLIFSNFLVDLQFSLVFCRVIKINNILKKGQMNWNWYHLSREHDFWAEFGSRAKIDRVAPGAPPPNLTSLSDIKLVRVN